MFETQYTYIGRGYCVSVLYTKQSIYWFCLQDAANSSDVVHEFEVVKRDEYEEDLGMVQLRAKVGSSYCYLAFGSDNLLVHKTCNSEPSAKKPTVETFFSIMPV